MAVTSASPTAFGTPSMSRKTPNGLPADAPSADVRSEAGFRQQTTRSSFHLRGIHTGRVQLPSPGRVGDVLTRAGFRDVTVTPVRTTVEVGKNAATAAESMLAWGAFRGAVDQIDTEAVETARSALTKAVGPFETPLLPQNKPLRPRHPSCPEVVLLPTPTPGHRHALPLQTPHRRSRTPTT
jgi:hypothetical protein